jgi:hypothetical protein
MSLPARFLEVLAAEVGTREEGGNNRGERIQVYQSATWLQPGAWPWCAAFVAFGLRTALIRAGVTPAAADRWRCRDASAFGWIAWAQRAPGCVVLPPDAAPTAGDLVVFDFNGPTAAGGGHIAAVERDLPGAAFATIEGNTNDAGDRDSTRGDGVLRKTRTNKTVVNFIRLPSQLPA